jgi:hypothetical protein
MRLIGASLLGPIIPSYLIISPPQLGSIFSLRLCFSCRFLRVSTVLPIAQHQISAFGESLVLPKVLSPRDRGRSASSTSHQSTSYPDVLMAFTNDTSARQVMSIALLPTSLSCVFFVHRPAARSLVLL